MSASTTHAVSIARRAVRASPAVRTVVSLPPLRRAVAAQRAARALRPAGRFLLRETRAATVACYTIRGTEFTVHLRHGSRDVEIFNEIFARRRMSYEPPEEVAAVLDRLGPLHVADLGGNIGLFGLYALSRWPIASLRSYEPDPANAALLQTTIAANQADGVWELERTAVSNVNSTARFETGLLSESRLAAGGRQAAGGRTRSPGTESGAATIEVSIVDLFEQPLADLLKIDIEGAEWAILGDPRLAAHPARAIVLEWHQRLCPGPKARHAARALLEVAGYAAFAEQRGERGAQEQDAAANGLMWGLRL